MPVCFAIATSVVAFLPMGFVPGFSGQAVPGHSIDRHHGVCVISLVESLWVLPAHLAAVSDPKETGLVRRGLSAAAEASSGRWSGSSTAPTRWGLHRSAAVPRVPRSPQGSPCSSPREVSSPAATSRSGSCRTSRATSWSVRGRNAGRDLRSRRVKRIQARMQKIAQDIVDDNGEEGIVLGCRSPSWAARFPGDPGQAQALLPGGHLSNVQFYFVESGERNARDRRLHEAPGASGWDGSPAPRRSTSSRPPGPNPGAPINIELVSTRTWTLLAVASEPSSRRRCATTPRSARSTMAMRWASRSSTWRSRPRRPRWD